MTEPMRLLLVIDCLGSGGAQRQMVNLALALNDRGHDVVFFCYAEGDLLAEPLRARGIPIVRHIKKSRFSLDVVVHLYALIRGGHFDGVLAYLSTPSFYATVAARLTRSRPFVVVSERSSDQNAHAGLLERGVRRLYALADQVVLNSHHQRRYLVGKYPGLSSKARTIYNGVDLERFSPSDGSARPDGSHPLRILVVASVLPYKNGLCLVRALPILRDKYQLRPSVDWVGVHVTFSREAAEYLRRMQAEIEQEGLAEQWTWLYERTDVEQLMQQHDVLVHPSYREGVPNAVCEAMACGLPVILSDTLDHPLLVSEGQTGFLFDWQSPEDLAAAIKRYADLPGADRRRMSLACRRDAETKFSMKRLCDEYEGLFRELSASR
jgi:GalNAc-alpha-(1->4)-GalNAc-alpha-(1->3)-diNAcBac-PP-undecaprenol alpha-1,4-N-acetyl-D-galactosaminyltransferase